MLRNTGGHVACLHPVMPNFVTCARQADVCNPLSLMYILLMWQPCGMLPHMAPDAFSRFDGLALQIMHPRFLSQKQPLSPGMSASQ